jgi:hypothetical protein
VTVKDVIVAVILFGGVLAVLIVIEEILANLNLQDVVHHGDDRDEEHPDQGESDDPARGSDQGGDGPDEQGHEGEEQPEDDSQDPLGAL